MATNDQEESYRTLQLLIAPSRKSLSKWRGGVEHATGPYAIHRIKAGQKGFETRGGFTGRKVSKAYEKKNPWLPWKKVEKNRGETKRDRGVTSAVPATTDSEGSLEKGVPREGRDTDRLRSCRSAGKLRSRARTLTEWVFGLDAGRDFITRRRFVILFIGGVFLCLCGGDQRCKRLPKPIRLPQFKIPRGGNGGETCAKKTKERQPARLESAGCAKALRYRTLSPKWEKERKKRRREATQEGERRKPAPRNGLLWVERRDRITRPPKARRACREWRN